MNKFIWFGILILPSLIVNAQSESTIKDIDTKKTVFLNDNTLFTQHLSFPVMQQGIVLPSYQPLTSYLKIPSNTSSITNQYAFDFGFQQIKFLSLSDKLSIYLSKKDESYQDMGSVYVAQALLVWKVNRKLTATGGIFLNKQITPMDLPPFMSHGFSSQLQYSVTKKIQLNLYGNYLNYNPDDPYTKMNSLFTQTKVGANVSYIKDEFHKIGIGLEHQYNVSTEQWEPVYGTHITYKFPSR